MPLPFFTVCLFKRINRWYSVLAVTLTSVLLIELLQLLLLTGSSDIDDVILNVSGRYAFLRASPYTCREPFLDPLHNGRMAIKRNEKIWTVYFLRQTQKLILRFR